MYNLYNFHIHHVYRTSTNSNARSKRRLAHVRLRALGDAKSNPIEFEVLVVQSGASARIRRLSCCNEPNSDTERHVKCWCQPKHKIKANSDRTDVHPHKVFGRPYKELDTFQLTCRRSLPICKNALHFSRHKRHATQ